MPDIGSVLRKNAGTVGMLLFTVAFYLFAHFYDTPVEPGIPSPQGSEISRSITQEFKDREVILKENMQKHPGVVAGVSLFVLVFIFSGLGLDVYYLSLRAQGKPLLPQTLAHHSVGWGMREVFQIFVLLFFVEAVIVLGETLLNSFLDIQGFGKSFFLMLNSLIRDIVVAGFVVALVTRRFSGKLSDIGLTTKNLSKNILIGLTSYLAAIPALILMLVSLSLLFQVFSYEPEPQPVVGIYLKESSQSFILFLTFFVAIIGPVIEEIFFRGFAYKAIRSRFGVRAAMFGTALIFSALHMHFVAFLPIFVLGIFLSYLYEKTGSLVPCMTAHMLHNTIMVTMTLGFKWFSS